MEQYWQKIKSFWLLIPAAVMTIFSGWLLMGTGGLLPFAGEILKKECRKLNRLQKNILDLREQNRQLRLETRSMKEFRSGALSVSDEIAAEKLREQVERIAAASGITINSLREIQQTPVAEEWNAFSLNFSADCAIANLQDFLSGVDNSMPRLYWRSLTLRPDNTNSPSKVILDGQLILLNYTGEPE